MNILLGVSLVALIFAIPGLGFSEAVLAQMGVNRLRKLMRGDNGAEEFTADEQVRLLSTILMLRLFGILLLGGMVMLAGVQVVRLAQLEGARALILQVAMMSAVGLGMVSLDTVSRRHARVKAQTSATTAAIRRRRCERSWSMPASSSTRSAICSPRCSRCCRRASFAAARRERPTSPSCRNRTTTSR